MHSDNVRKTFIDFFVAKGHKHIASSSTLPHGDASLLFTNAGMNQFKNYFLGIETPPYLRAVSVQKIIRAGGKHNDLDNVGKTARHHTFFEMLGNFSFGDYFKETAIANAWEFLTQVLGLPKEKLAVSVYQEDEESLQIWHKKIGMPLDKIAKLGTKDNFWAMGDTGPCGPCSEIHFDLHSERQGSGVIASLEQDDGRFLEIWNLVFMQFDKKQNGKLVLLPAPSVDTGMGLERIVSVIQAVDSNYKTDIFLPLLAWIAKEGNYTYGANKNLDISVRVIADHLRSVSIIIADGVLPANEGRGYVLRRIIRRALRHAKYLQQPLGSFAAGSVFFAQEVQNIFPEVYEQKDSIYKYILQEEKRFASTLDNGLKILLDLIAVSKKQKKTELQGESLFKLYDTYGFPMELATEILAENTMSYNKRDFEVSMQKQKETARKQQIFKQEKLMKPLLDIQNIWTKQKEHYKNEFVGYQPTKIKSKLQFIWNDKLRLTQVSRGEKFYCILAKTPFYAESGGQVGDTGWLKNEDFIIRILNTQKSPNGLNYSLAKLEVANKNLQLRDQDNFMAELDVARRKQIQTHHTSTHLLNAALREVVGLHIKQAGSLVNEQKLRFDFQHFEPLNTQALTEVAELVNNYIRENEEVLSKTMPIDQALATGALAFFGEKYKEQVRVVQAGRHSKELCGGCHTSRTGDLGFFQILSESSCASGIRRIEAVAGSSAWSWQKKQNSKFQLLASILQESTNKIFNLDQSIQAAKHKSQHLAHITNENKLLKARILKDFLTQVKTKLSKKKLLFLENTTTLLDNKNLADSLMRKFQPELLCLYKIDGLKVEVLLSKNKALEGFQAGEFIKKHSSVIGGKGGGNDIFARCSGNNYAGLAKLQKLLEEQVQ